MGMIFDNLKDSLKSIRKKPLLFFFCILIDIFAVFLFGVIRSFFARIIIAPLNQLMISAQKRSQISILEQAAAEDIGNFGLEAAKTKQEILLITLLFIAILAILWGIVQGSSWFTATRIAEKKRKEKFFKYILRFSLASLIWITALGLIFIIILAISIPKDIYSPLNPLQTITLYFAGYVLLPIVLFFAPISLSLATKHKSIKENLKNTIRIGIKNFFLFIMLYGIIIMASYIIMYFQAVISNAWATLFLGLFLSLPLIAFARIFLIKLLEKSTL
ncbi:MAG: hypothetical protein ACLFPQ_06185 [Candidatus Woesearchaeota archaeon]